jgi:tetratricopeptide (TPR) repeat protein
VQQNPDSRRLRLQRALDLERDGRARESLAELEALAAEASDSPELLAHLGRALGFANRSVEAESLIAGALAHWPADARLHSLLVELRWQRGAGAEATSTLERAIHDFPAELQLRLVAADLLRSMGYPARALQLLEEGLGRAPDSAAFLTSTGVMLDELDRPADALALLRAAIPRARYPAQAQRNLVPALLRTGAVEEARSICDALLAATPDDQMLLAYRTTALRLAGDAEHARLCDFGRLVRTYVLDPPPSYGGIEKFNETLGRVLTVLHQAVQRPIAQSLRGGTQTARNDLPVDDPVVADFMGMLDAPIRDYISRLDATSLHPVDRRKRESYRVTGSWSVLLSPGGFHVDHVHPQGWLSSAYYVELPRVERDESRAAWLKFGEPGVKVGLPPEYFVKPTAGMLVLFPSYFWHGTVPFHEGGGRLTAAFDVVPAD